MYGVIPSFVLGLERVSQRRCALTTVGFVVAYPARDLSAIPKFVDISLASLGSLSKLPPPG